MNRDDIIRMARECGIYLTDTRGSEVWWSDLMAFGELVAAAERERLRWNGIHTCGPTCDNPACVAVREAVEAEREACAKVCDAIDLRYINQADKCAAAIRARGEK